MRNTTAAYPTTEDTHVRKAREGPKPYDRSIMLCKTAFYDVPSSASHSADLL
jgi:hypothetical protein